MLTDIIPVRSLSRDLAELNVTGSWLQAPIEARRMYVELREFPVKWVEAPVDLETFVTGKRYMNHPGLSDIQYEAVEAASTLFEIDNVLENPYEVIIRRDKPTTAVMVWGKGSGKDTCSMLIMARILYLLGCLVSPHDTFRMPRTSSIDMLNMAVTADQARYVYFAPLKRMIVSSPWFMNKLRVQVYGSSIRVPPVIGHDETMGDLYAVNAWSGDSSQEGAEGKNLLCCVLDEIDAFRTLAHQTGGNKNTWAVGTAEGLHEAMHSSVQSRFPGVGVTVLISWPRYRGSHIWKQMEYGRTDPRYFVSGPYATWEVHPLRTKEDFAPEFRRNPEQAWAKYGAQPGEAEDRYYTDVAAVFNTFHAIRDDDWNIVRDPVSPGREPPFDWNTMQMGNLPEIDYGGQYCWHIDLALNRDRAGIAMAHHVGWIEDVATQDWLPVVQLDLAYWWEARHGEEIQFSDVRNFVLNLAKRGYRTVSVTLDGWQSVDTIQILSRYGQDGQRVVYTRDGKPRRPIIEAGYFSVDRNLVGHDTLKELVYDPGGRLLGFFCPLLVEELLNLIKIGGKVDHPEGGSKDVADAVAGAVYGAVTHLRNDLDMPQYRGQGQRGRVMIGVSSATHWDVDDHELSVTGVVKRPKAIA